MKFLKIFFVVAFVSIAMTACKNEAKKEDTTQEKTENVANAQELSLNISGMTCEIGCAKKIASDLNKKEGVLNATVVFKDSLATIKYDADKTNKKDLIAFVEGIGSGDMYKATETTKKACKEDCKMTCCSKTDGDNKTCEGDCNKECCSKADADKKACDADCKKECCTKKEGEKTACATDCKKECCAENKKA